MKHQEMVDEAREMLVELKIEIEPSTLQQAVRHLEWVLTQNRTLNLTSITDPIDALRLHLVDSLTALPALNEAKGGALCDMGTGGGFPGLPLALASGRRTVLADSVGKKVKALDQFLADTQLRDQVSTTSLRIEDLGSKLGGTFAAVTARALAPLPSLVELSTPLLTQGGRLIAMKGRLTLEELDAGDRVADLLGLQRESIDEFTLPRHGEARTLVTYVRVGATSIPLPRRVGLAQKRPLA